MYNIGICGACSTYEECIFYCKFLSKLVQKQKKMYWKLNLRTDVGRGGRAALCCHPGPRFNAALFSTLIAPPWRTFNFWPLKEFHKRALQQCRAGAPVWLIGTTFLPGCSSWLILQLLLSQGSLMIHKTVMWFMSVNLSYVAMINSVILVLEYKGNSSWHAQSKIEYHCLIYMWYFQGR